MVVNVLDLFHELPMTNIFVYIWLFGRVSPAPDSLKPYSNPIIFAKRYQFHYGSYPPKRWMCPQIHQIGGAPQKVLQQIQIW